MVTDLWAFVYTIDYKGKLNFVKLTYKITESRNDDAMA